MISPTIKKTVKFLRASLPATIEIRQNMDHDASAALGDPAHPPGRIPINEIFGDFP